MSKDSQPAESRDTKERKKEMIYYAGNLYQRYKRGKIASPAKKTKQGKKVRKTTVSKRL